MQYDVVHEARHLPLPPYIDCWHSLRSRGPRPCTKDKGRTRKVRPLSHTRTVRQAEVLRGRDDADGLAPAVAAELDRTGDQREQRVVAPAAHVQAGVEVRAALAHDDLAGVDGLTAEALHTEALSVRVTAVAAGRGALLMCHVLPPPVIGPARDRQPAKP